MASVTHSSTAQQEQPWQRPEQKRRAVVARVRAGRSLKPATWPADARVAVALSFDSDRETSAPRSGRHNGVWFAKHAEAAWLWLENG